MIFSLRNIAFLWFFGLVQLAGISSVQAERQGDLILVTTTSTVDSGLLDYLLPKFTADSGIRVKVVSVGTGRALQLGRAGDADILLVHHLPSEEAFVNAGYGLERHNLMYNDFVVIGPHQDPAGIRKADSVSDAFTRIADQKIRFLSRGDQSGTHKKELSIWREAGVPQARLTIDWYLESGAGMGSTLNTSAGLRCYTIADRSTWMQFGNKGDQTILFENDTLLYNQYGITLLNPERFPHTHHQESRILQDWLLSNTGQSAINRFRINGRQAFFANAQ